MALFRRSKPDLAAIVAQEVEKALAQTPMAGAGGSVVSMPGEPSGYNGGGGQGLLQTPGTPASPLPRPSDAFGAQLGPAQPFLPAPLDPVFDDSGRALPRKYQYDVAWNLNLQERLTPWSTLKALADQCDVVHRCIEIKCAELVSMNLDFTVSDQAISKIMADQNVGHAKASQIARDLYGKDIDDLKQFWENPYVHGDRGWAEWLTEFAWQHFTFDGVPVYPRYNLGGKVMGFEIIDAPTIKPLLDNRGDIPHPPAPAFQQILWGFPRGEYQASPTNDGEFFVDAGQGGEFVRDQLAYFVRNRRTWSPYGYGPVEQSIPAATLYLERQMWLKAEYSEGTMPTTFMRTDSRDGLDHLKLAQLERVLNDNLTGQTAERHKIKMLPEGFDPVFAPSIDERYKAEYDEFLIKRIASPFGVAPTQLGIIPRTGLGGRGQMEGEQDQAETMSKRPTEAFIVDCINSLSRRFLGADRSVTAVLAAEGSMTDQVNHAKALQVSLYSGQKTLNTVQSELGQPLYDMPEADEPFIVAGNAVTFLKGMLEQTTAGETIGQTAQAPGNGAESAQAPAEPGQPAEEQPTPKANPNLSAPEGKAAASEMKAFRAFVAKRKETHKWRDFDFKTVGAEVAETLNEQGRATVEKASRRPLGRQASYQGQDI